MAEPAPNKGQPAPPAPEPAAVLAPPQTAPLAPVMQAPRGESPLAIPPEWGLVLPIGDYRSTIDESTEEGAARLFAFLNGDGLKPEDCVNITKPVCDISMMPIAKEHNGELLPLPRIGVHHPDGTFTDFRSPGIMKSLGFLIKRFGYPPWSPPRELKLTRIKTGVTEKGEPKYMYRYTLP